MFGLFKKKSEKDKLNDRYEQLMKEAHALSTIDRKKSDQKHSEAQDVLTQIDHLESNS